MRRCKTNGNGRRLRACSAGDVATTISIVAVKYLSGGRA